MNNYLKNTTRLSSRGIAIILFLGFLIPDLFSQSATTANISGTNSVININNNTATVVDPGIVLTANGNITGFTVSITGSYTSGDVLSYTGTLPSGISAAAFNTATRSLVFSGTTTAANWQALMRTVTLTTTSAVCNPESRLVSFVVGIKYYNILNGHFYEYYGTGTSWTNARNYAAGLSYFGREGYLATVSAQSENSFSSVLVGMNSWIGCSDNYLEINSALGYTLYASQAAADGNFYWITGPERGMKISSQNAWGSGGVLPVSGVYNGWSSGEPNDWPGLNSSSPGEEDYGHMYTGSGLWNDFPVSSSIGSIIEFGGMPNDNTTSQVVFTRSVFINGAPSGTITGGNVSVCSGSNSTLLTLSGLTGTIVRWESSLDNFLTAGTTIASTASTYTASNIVNTTYYRVVVNTISGCSNLATSSTPVYVSTTIAGNIVAANNTICAGANADFTLFGHSGSVVKWQVSTSSTFASGITDISNTTTSMSYNLASVGTYYFRAVVQNSGCGSPVNTPIYTISVVAGTAPVGGTVSSNEHCGGTNSGTLTLSGHTGTIQKWQYSIDGGIIWTDVANTSTTLNYASVSANRIYRAKLVNGSCGTAYSSSGSITVYGTTVCRWDGTISTDWQTSGNWCGGVADAGKDVVLSTTAPNTLVLDQNRIIGRLDFNNSNKIIEIGNFNLTCAGFLNYNSSNCVKTAGSGKILINIPNAGSFVYPLYNGSYTPVTIGNNTGSADYISVRLLDDVYVSGYTGFTSNEGRVKRTWDIGKTNANGGSGLNFTFNWNGGDESGLTTPTLYHYESGAWNAQSGSTSSSSGTFTFTGYTGTFSPFAIGNPLTPLPVSLFNFRAVAKASDKTVSLFWETGNEVHNCHFDVQKSIDGINWTVIGNLKGNNNGASSNVYTFKDLQPDNVNYYRIVVHSESGETVYSGIKKTDFNTAGNFIIVYPNPSAAGFEINTSEAAVYTITDLQGREILKGECSGSVAIRELEPGIYMLYLDFGTQVYSVKITRL